MVPHRDGEGDNGDESLAGDSGTATESVAARIDPSVLGLDHVYSALSHPRRRYLMYALAENSEWTLNDLATKLVAWEEGIDEAAVEPHQRDQRYVSLYHTHVPKLVEEGVIEYDHDAETIARGNHAEQVFAVLAGAGSSLDIAQEQHAKRAYESDPGAESNE